VITWDGCRLPLIGTSRPRQDLPGASTAGKKKAPETDVNGQFTTAEARIKLKRPYPTMQN